MKGFIIYEVPSWGDEENVVYGQEVKDASYELKSYCGSQEFTSCLKGEASKVSKAKCSPDDSYDFEIGALIALMKMCGVDKVVRACNEAFSEDTFKTYATKYERELNELKKDSDKVIDELIEEINQKNHEIISLKALKLTNEALKKDNESFRKVIDAKSKDMEKLQHEHNLCKNSENALKCTVDLLNKSIAKLDKAIYGYKEDLYKVCKHCRELEEENEKLKLDCEKLQHGYNEWLHRPSTKRGEMWEKIFELHKENDVIIKVKREDINAFLHEIENKIPEITWASFVKIFETKYTIGDIYGELKTHDVIYFRLSKINTLSYSSDPHTYQYRELKSIDYHPPMRWDLFKKGRIVVGIKNKNELEEFRKEVERNTGIKDIPTCPTNLCLFYMFDKDEYKIILNSVTAANIAKINGHKVYYWEDVR